MRDEGERMMCGRCGWAGTRDEVSALQHVNGEKQWRKVDLWMLRLRPHLL
jgi:hypothetical protein